jgi:hypothetical protein
MGAIARNIANNITTSGVFTSSAIANSSVTGITVLANASDGITFISSQTASNSASLSFTGLNSTYKAYKFVLSSIHQRTDSEALQFNLSTDNGSNYNVTKTTTFFQGYNNEAGNSYGLSYETGQDLAQSTSYQTIFKAQTATSDESGSGSLLLFNPSSTTYVKHFIANTSVLHGGEYALNQFIAGYGNTTSAVNAIRFLSTGGTNFDGTIAMYGIK